MSINVLKNDDDNILRVNQGAESGGDIRLSTARKDTYKEPQEYNMHMFNEDVREDEISNNDNDYNNDSVEDDVSEEYNPGVENNFNDGRSFADIEREKAECLSKLNRLAQNPKLQVRRLDYSYSLEEIKSEVMRCEKDEEIIRGVELYRTGLSFFVQGSEWGMTAGLNMETMKGWSNAVNMDITSNNYDKVLADIYEIWGGAAMTRPEIQLVFMLGMSGLNYHTNRKMALQQNTEYYQRTRPNMRGPAENTDDILRELDKESVISSDSSEAPPPPPKKRGRKKKNQE